MFRNSNCILSVTIIAYFFPIQTFVLFLGKFWQFTWDEMAKYDVPAMIEKVFILHRMILSSYLLIPKIQAFYIIENELRIFH